ncbi:MAG: hypothetical protein GC190_09280 [Alphaproteobacteria bacterium]|nr:hypothetical protein [Alphaproteobacteria bacterium]
MLRLTELKLPLNHTDAELRSSLLKRLGIAETDLIDFSVFRRAADARKPKQISLTYTLDVALRNEPEVLKRLKGDRNVGPTPDMTYRPPTNLRRAPPKRPVVIGAGPCGFFAALILAEMGFRPILLERGKIVRERTKDTFAFWRRRELNPESNAQFGEGGAGTFSDGKLYSGVKDPRHLGRKVLTEFVAAGAPEDILYAAKPHIGTFRLVAMVERLRAKIENLGGEFRFETRVDRIGVGKSASGDRCVEGLLLSDGSSIETDHVVLAVGHSARDTFQMLYDEGVHIEPKPFSIGFRIEHPQSLIDRCRFGPNAGNKILGAADYKIVHHASNGRSVYSFCMCPGGTVVATASEPGRVVTNGMSQYSRNERNANAGIVVGITQADYPGHPLAGIALQRHWEERAFAAGGANYSAPGQRVGDFIAAHPSTAFGSVVPSYRPSVTPTDLSDCLPDYAVAAIREALPAFDKQIPGFAMADATLTGVETRTSSPISIRRGVDFQSINTRGLYPAGEGAGYAGGILTAAIDGIKVAEAIARATIDDAALAP